MAILLVRQLVFPVEKCVYGLEHVLKGILSWEPHHGNPIMKIQSSNASR